MIRKGKRLLKATVLSVLTMLSGATLWQACGGYNDILVDPDFCQGVTDPASGCGSATWGDVAAW